MIATGPCISCGQLFSFNPELVSSTTAITGTKEPVCRVCMDAINAKRKSMGLPPVDILPGAYEPTEHP
jgi:hypothetical protein